MLSRKNPAYKNINCSSINIYSHQKDEKYEKDDEEISNVKENNSKNIIYEYIDWTKIKLEQIIFH